MKSLSLNSQKQRSCNPPKKGRASSSTAHKTCKVLSGKPPNQQHVNKQPCKDLERSATMKSVTKNKLVKGPQNKKKSLGSNQRATSPKQQLHRRPIIGNLAYGPYNCLKKPDQECCLKGDNPIPLQTSLDSNRLIGCGNSGRIYQQISILPQHLSPTNLILKQNIVYMHKINSHIVRKDHWQAYQALVAKNHEVTKNIKELARMGVSEHLQFDRSSDKPVEQTEYSDKIDKLVKNKDNYAQLQAVVKDRDSQVSALHTQCQVLQERISQNRQREGALMKELAETVKMAQDLQYQMDECNKSCATLRAQRDVWKQKYSQSKLCYEEVRKEAQIVLKLVQSNSRSPQDI